MCYISLHLLVCNSCALALADPPGISSGEFTKCFAFVPPRITVQVHFCFAATGWMAKWQSWTLLAGGWRRKLPFLSVAIGGY